MPKQENNQSQLQRQIESTRKAIARQFMEKLKEVEGRRWNFEKAEGDYSSSRPYNPNEAAERLREFLTGATEWQASAEFTPTLSAVKVDEKGTPTGHLKAQFDVASGEFKIDDYNTEGKITKRLKLDNQAPRVRQYDTLTFSYPAQSGFVSRRGWQDTTFIDYGGMR
ncbi:MAG TPA: hypothetical protein VF189_03030 [Patescibacteria group bacterium]